MQKRLLDETYKCFVRGGANLNAGPEDTVPRHQRRTVDARHQVRRQPAARHQQLPPRHRARSRPEGTAAVGRGRRGADAAKAAGLAGKWVFTLQAPSIWPFLQYADNRELRKQILTAYTTRNDHNDQYDNKALLAQTAALRAERAALLGYKTHADFVLEENMAKTPDQVYALLNQLWEPARAMACAKRPTSRR